eukprot:CAMPEP_0117560006 /NCGR_PEP_ID=MMETSP0784-20121206/53653_1 /TAXON_ID=39447 /ORGANISM="" /LENGTH=68 /DNA_ID=CAMNT_0005357401 /DNA_START=293 /DNA_END=499 /DNA_ORIENTATION=-
MVLSSPIALPIPPWLVHAAPFALPLPPPHDEPFDEPVHLSTVTLRPSICNPLSLLTAFFASAAVANFT